MLLEVLTNVATVGLAHQTYVATYHGRPKDEWPHWRLINRTRTVVCGGRAVVTHLTYRAHHHGMVLLWNVWSLCRLPVRRVEAEGGGEDE